MHIPKTQDDFLLEVAKAAELCLKPWKYSVLREDDLQNSQSIPNDFSELILRIECRDSNGERHPENDLEIEIFRSGSDLNVTLAWVSFPLRPILWHGKRPLWMNATNGQPAVPPDNGDNIEALARRLRARFSSIAIDQ